MQKIGTRARRKSALITLSCLQNFFFKEKVHKITRVTFQIDTKGHLSSAKKIPIISVGINPCMSDTSSFTHKKLGHKLSVLIIC